MKFIITESKFDQVIQDYLDDLFKIDDIHSTNPYVMDDETDEEYEDDNHIEFYIGDYDEENTIFDWYSCDYFYEDVEIRNRCPIVHIDEEYSNSLNGYFGDKWVEPFKKWFKTNFDLPVKSVKF